MHSLDAHTNLGGEVRNGDILGVEVLAQSHDGIFTSMVNSVKSNLSPDWRWSGSPIRGRWPGMTNRIRELREARGLTLEQLAEHAGTTFQQIQRLERGERRLTDDWMRRIAPGLGVKPAALLMDEAPDEREFAQNIEERLLLQFWRLLDSRDKRFIAMMARERGLDILKAPNKK